MTCARRILVAAALACIAPRVSFAQSVEAEMLFRDGKRLIKEGKIGEGCDKLEASNKLESSVGTLLNLADCREKNHQLASAWITFRKAETAAKVASDPKRGAEAGRRASTLEKRLSKISIVVGERVEGLAITRNGAAVDSAVWGTGLPVDQGDYDIAASAPGFVGWKSKVSVAKEGETVEVRVPTLERPSVKVTPKETPEPAPNGSPPDEEPEEAPVDTPSRFTAMRKIAIGVGVVGVGALATGIVFGLRSKDKQEQADAICPEAACTDRAAVNLNQDAQGAALGANVMFGVGAAGVIGAAVLWFAGAPASTDHVAVTPMMGRSQAVVVLEGRF